MRRVTLIGEDHGRTRYTLDIDPEKVRLKNRHTLLVARPEWFDEDDGPDEEELDGMFLIRSWYDHDDEFLEALGIRIVGVFERGKPLERGEPWEAGKIPLPDELSSAVPLTQELIDGTVWKVMVRVPDFRQVRPWGWIASPPCGEDGEEVVLGWTDFYHAALKGEYGLSILGVYPIHLTN